MATIHQARKAVVGLLYAYDLGNSDILKFVDTILEEKKIRNKKRLFSYELFNGTIDNLETIDNIIYRNLKDWEYDYIGKVEKAIIRLAVYEMIIDKKDSKIVINEAIELSKDLADEKAPKFINALLDHIYKNEGKEHAS
jgi:N utilization substance protein B